MTDNLIQFVTELDIPAGTKTALLSQLNSALTKIQDGNINGAIGSLNGLINHALAQSGKKLTEAEADAIIAAAQTILGTLPDQQNGQAGKAKKKSVGASTHRFSITTDFDNHLTIQWEHGVLEFADKLSGPWQSLPQATSPHVLAREGFQKFFRLKTTTAPSR